MAGMTKARKQVAEDLQNAGLSVRPDVPAKVVPPLVIISTGDPMLEEEEKTYKNATEFLYRLDLYCVIGTKPSADQVAALEEMVEQVLFNLGEWAIERVSPPTLLEANGNQYLTAIVTITNTIEIGGY